MAIRDWLQGRKRAEAPDVARLEAANRELVAVNAQLIAALEEKLTAERALAHGEAHFRASFESAAVGQVHYDPVNGKILRANQAYADMLGYAPDELIGRVGSDFTYPEDKDPAPYGRMVGGQVEAYAREKRYVRRDGSLVWGRVSASVARDPDSGAPMVAIAIVEDVDDYHSAQDALRAATQDLEQTVEQLTATLGQRDLLLREVYHRVKNNLQIVDSLLLLQAGQLEDPTAKAALANLRRRVHALGLAHHQVMGSDDLETFDIAPFLNDLSDGLREGLAERGIGLCITAAPLPVGLDFAIPLGLLVTELVTAALERPFPETGGKVVVSLFEAADGAVMLEVADDSAGGAALPPGGLGATIVDGLVRQLGGDLSTAGAATVVRLPTPGAA